MKLKRSRTYELSSWSVYRSVDFEKDLSGACVEVTCNIMDSVKINIADEIYDFIEGELNES